MSKAINEVFRKIYEVCNHQIYSILLNFFKINDPYRLIAILIIGIGIKLPFIIGGCATLEMEKSLLIGEAVASTSMYYGILDNTAPLAAGVYWLIAFVAGKSPISLHILGTLLLILQAIIFNNLAIRNKVYEQNTYLPAFAYLIIGSIQYNLSSFSSAQMGMTFILLAFSQLLSHVEFRAKREEQIMSIGLLTGIASLFYLPLIIFLPIILIILLVFTNTLSRRYFILIISAAMPQAVAFAYYWVLNGVPDYYIANFILPTLDFGFNAGASIQQSYPVLLPITILGLLGFATMPKQRRLNNYQNRLAQLFFATGLLILIIPLLTALDLQGAILLYLPILAFFATHLFFLIRRPMADLVASVTFIGTSLFLAYQTEFHFMEWPKKIEERTKVNQGLLDLVKNKKIWVLGDEPELYTHGKLGTTFYNWQLSKPYLENLDYYDNLVFIKKSVDRFKPEVILDYEFMWKKLVLHIPSLEEDYEQIRPFVYKRK